MISHDRLQQLHDLDRTSPRFHKQLDNFLRGNEYQNTVPSLQSGDLAWFAEYLDSASLQITSSRRPTLNAGVDLSRYFRSRKRPISEVTA